MTSLSFSDAFFSFTEWGDAKEGIMRKKKLRHGQIFVFPLLEKSWGLWTKKKMNYIYFLTETFTNGYKVEVLDVFSILAVLCGILVIIIKNPVLSVLFLIGLFLSIASYLMVLGLNFIGLSYLLVYVGAVSILFLFILMLINVRVSELASNTRNSIVLAIFISISFNFPVYEILPYSIAEVKSYNLSMATTLDQIWQNYSDFLFKLLKLNSDEIASDKIYFVTSKLWDGNLSESSHITSIGNIMYTSYSMWLILTSIILLLAMVGAIVITIKQKNKPQSEEKV